MTSFNSVALDQQWPRGLTRRDSEVVLLREADADGREEERAEARQPAQCRQTLPTTRPVPSCTASDGSLKPQGHVA